MIMDDPYDEKRVTPVVPWTSAVAMPRRRQSACQMGAPTLVGPHHAPVEKQLDPKSAHRSETSWSSDRIRPTQQTTRKGGTSTTNATLTAPAYS
jgi:hypothetical protein